MTVLRQTLDQIRNDILDAYFPKESYPKDYRVDGHHGYSGREFKIAESSGNQKYTMCSYYHKFIEPHIESIVVSYGLAGLGLDISDRGVEKSLEAVTEQLYNLSGGDGIHLTKSIAEDDINKIIDTTLEREKRLSKINTGALAR